MKKNLDFRLAACFLVVTFIVNMTGAAYSMDTIKSKSRWIKTKASSLKEKTLDRLVKRYRNTQELGRKKADGTATPAELKELKRLMRNIQRVAVAIGITLVTIAIAGGTLAYREYRKRERWRQAEKEGIEADEAIALARADTTEAISRHFIKKYVDGLKLGIALDHLDTGKITRLLKAGVDPNTKLNYRKETPLHYFLSPEIAQIFINAGANLNAKDWHGNTPLHRFAEEGNITWTSFLLEAGADPLIRNNKGQLPSDVAEWMEVKQLLLDAINIKRQAIARREMRTANPALMGLPRDIRMLIGEEVGVETPIHAIPDF